MDQVDKLLENLLIPIREAAVTTVETLLDVNVVTDSSMWCIEERLNGEFDHIITLGCSNADYQGVIMFATMDSSISSILHHDEEVYDIFGELANTYCGILMDKEEVVNAFGVLNQAVPMYAAKRAFFPRAWAVVGTLSVNGKNVQVGFAIRSFMMLGN